LIDLRYHQQQPFPHQLYELQLAEELLSLSLKASCPMKV